MFSEPESRYITTFRKMTDASVLTGAQIVAGICQQYYDLPADAAEDVAVSFFVVYHAENCWNVKAAAIVARDGSLDYWRRRRRTPVAFDTTRARRTALVAVLSALRPRYRELLRGYYLDNPAAPSEGRVPLKIRRLVGPVRWQALEVQEVLVGLSPMDPQRGDTVPPFVIESQ